MTLQFDLWSTTLSRGDGRVCVSGAGSSTPGRLLPTLIIESLDGGGGGGGIRKCEKCSDVTGYRFRGWSGVESELITKFSLVFFWKLRDLNERIYAKKNFVTHKPYTHSSL